MVQDQQLTSQEHRHLLKILFAHELQRSNVSSNKHFEPVLVCCGFFLTVR